MLGLAVRTDSRGPLGAHRVLLLVKGTEVSQPSVVGDAAKSLEEQSYKISSRKARCLLSDADAKVDLVGYCDFVRMLTYRLDEDAALILVSNVSPNTPASDSVGAGGAAYTSTIESMQKVTVDECSALRESMAVEWKSVLADSAPITETLSSKQQ